MNNYLSLFCFGMDTSSSSSSYRRAVHVLDSEPQDVEADALDALRTGVFGGHVSAARDGGSHASRAAR